MAFSFSPNQTTGGEGAEAAPVAGFALGNAPVGSPTTNTTEGDGPDWIVIILFVIFAILATITGALAFYQYQLDQTIEKKKAQLSQYESDLNKVNVGNIQDTSNKIKVVSQLVKNHPSMSTLFKVLELTIEDSVTYTTFTISTLKENSNAYALGVQGVSPDYKSIYRQIQNFKDKPFSGYISKVELSPLKVPDDKGNIKFNFQANVSINGVLPDNIVVQDTVSNNSTVSTSPSDTTLSTTTNP